ncbi:MAG: hypothetical protein M1839_004916 [Geoglossum umbratile]|nr:MAG: hypothetical protein M1839_004916 [Geoglossum umbratile]
MAPRQTDAERDREERRLLKKYRIIFNGPLASDKWPRHHRHAFSHVERLGHFRHGSYCTGVAPNGNYEASWRLDTKSRAERLAETAARLVRERPSEMTWRLELEKLVYGRFELQIEWSNIGLNPLFSNRADELILYGHDLASQVRDRKPDRIYGLQQTNNFEKELGKRAQMVHHLANAASTQRVMDTIESTPLQGRGDPLIFPFLIAEAKSAEGGGFAACGLQTAFPIWKLLKIQEQLEATTGRGLREQGGPLVWYVAYRGENWRISGCYTTEEEQGRVCYEIVDLWQGRVDSIDGALQILLIIDYIFDWARDVYRPGSLARGVMDWRNGIEPDSGPITDSTGQLADDDPRPWRSFDSEIGVFRPASAIETSFQCLYITGDSVGTLIDSLGETNRHIQEYAKRLLRALNKETLVISNRALCSLEEKWTGIPRKTANPAALKKNLFAVVAYQTYLSETWEQKRVISCLAIDEDALRVLCDLSKLKRGIMRIRKAEVPGKRVDEQAVEGIVQALLGQSISFNLAAAIARKTLVLTTKSVPWEPDRSSPISPSQFEFVDAESLHWQIQECVCTVYKRHKIGRREPTDPYIRFSSRLDNQTNHQKQQSSPFRSPPAVSLPEGRPVLIYGSDMRRHRVSVPEFCLYIMGEHQQPFEWQKLTQALMQAIKAGKIHITSHYHNSDRSRTGACSSLADQENPYFKKKVKAWCRSIQGGDPGGDNAGNDPYCVLSDDDDEGLFLLRPEIPSPWRARQKRLEVNYPRLAQEVAQTNYRTQMANRVAEGDSGIESPEMIDIEMARSMSLMVDKDSLSDEALEDLIKSGYFL